MKYTTGYYLDNPEKKENALLIQKLKGKGRRKDILFAAVCHGRDNELVSEYLARKLLDWFRYRVCSGKDRMKVETVWEESAGIMKEIYEELGEDTVSYGGILALGEEFVIFGNGGSRCLVLQNAFGQNVVRHTLQDLTMYVKTGVMEMGACLLLFAGDLPSRENENMWAEGLDVGNVASEEILQRRLTEIGRWEKKGREACGAVIAIKAME